MEGTNSGKLLENFQGISYRKWFSRNSTKKVTTVGKSGEILHFCFLENLSKAAVSYKLKMQKKRNLTNIYNSCSFKYAFQCFVNLGYTKENKTIVS